MLQRVLAHIINRILIYLDDLVVPFLSAEIDRHMPVGYARVVYQYVNSAVLADGFIYDLFTVFLP